MKTSNYGKYFKQYIVSDYEPFSSCFGFKGPSPCAKYNIRFSLPNFDQMSL